MPRQTSVQQRQRAEHYNNVSRTAGESQIENNPFSFVPSIGIVNKLSVKICVPCNRRNIWNPCTNNLFIEHIFLIHFSLAARSNCIGLQQCLPKLFDRYMQWVGTVQPLKAMPCSLDTANKLQSGGSKKTSNRHITVDRETCARIQPTAIAN